MSKDGKASGGLGAALSQYSTTSNEVGSNLTAMQRRSSGGNLLLASQSRTTSFNEQRRRAASPNFNAKFQPEISSSPKLFSSTLSNLAPIESEDQNRSGIFRNPAVLRPRPNRAAEGRDGSLSHSLMPPALFQSSGSMNYGMVRKRQSAKFMFVAGEKVLPLLFTTSRVH